MHIKKIYKLVLRSYIGPLILTFFIALFVLLMQFLWKYVDDLVGKGLEWYIIGQLMFYASSTFVPLALPLAILLSSIMTFGNLGENYELVAIKASGISLKKIMMPLVVLSIVISIATFYFSNNILPVANLKMSTLLYDIREQKPALNIKEGIFYREIDGYVIKVGKKEKDGKTIRNVLIYDHTDKGGNNNLTVAEYGTMEMTSDKRYLILKLYNGCNYIEKMENASQIRTRPLQRTKFKTEQLRLDLSAFAMKRTNEEFFKDNYKMMNIKQLKADKDTLSKYLERDFKIFKDFTISNFKTVWDYGGTNFLIQDSTKKFKTDFLSNFPVEEQRIIVENALNSVRTVNAYVSNYTSNEYETQRSIRRRQVEWHRKFSLAFSCLVLFFIGAPLGAIIRKGGLGLPLVISVGFFILFYVISMMGEKFVKEGIWPAWQGMWLASAVLLPIGIFLTAKATTDSPLLDADSWRKTFQRIFTFKKRKN